MTKISNYSIKIGSRTVGIGAPTFLIAEIAQQHDGSLGLAHAFVDAAAEAGAEAVKFQIHFAAAESTLDEPFRIKGSGQDETRYAYWKRMEFTPEQWAGIARHAADKRLAFLSSAFSEEAVGLLLQLKVPAWKIASGELSSNALLSAMIRSDRPFLVSSGMSPWSEIDALVSMLRNKGRQFALLQCTSEYPTPLEHVGLNVMEEMRSRYGCPAGLSDHSGSVFPALTAIARGAAVVELHLVLDRRMFGPDVSSSLTVDEFRLVADARNAVSRMDSEPVDKDAMAASLAPMRKAFGRSLAPKSTIQKGVVIRPDMLVMKKPGTGIPEASINDVVGRKLSRDVAPDRLLRWEDLE